jgi:aspartate-semialdehyde dehydrogenase
MKLVILATPPEVSKTLAPAAQAAGAWVVDASAAFRADPNVPLVHPGLNPGAIKGMRGRIVTIPSPLTWALVTALEPLRKSFGLDRAEVTAMVATSSGGVRGIEELERQTAELLSGREPEPSRFPHRIGFNLIPQVGEFDAETERTAEELAWSHESARLWGAGAPTIEGIAVQVPTFYGHGFSVFGRLQKQVSADDVREALRTGAGLKVLDSPQEKVYPMPMLITADPTVHVGRVRVSGNTVSFFGMVDNAGRGAAQNLVDVGELVTTASA